MMFGEMVPRMEIQGRWEVFVVNGDEPDYITMNLMALCVDVNP